MTERRADDATREVDAWLKCEFLKDRIGEVFPGVIAAVTNFGLFVELADLYIEGLLHVSALPGDYYHFDQSKQRLVGERTRQSFQLGGSMEVRVIRVDLDDRKIDLELARMPRGAKSAPSTPQSKARKQNKAGKKGRGSATPDKAEARALDRQSGLNNTQDSGSRAGQKKVSKHKAAKKTGQKKRSSKTGASGKGARRGAGKRR